MQSAVSAGRERGAVAGVQAADTDTVFEVLANSGCRAVLEAIGEKTLTATEVSEHVDAPMSSIYRHLDALTETGFLSESVRINTHGRNQNQYSRTIPGISVSLDDFSIRFD